jgi:hypothetical protein
MTRAFAHWAVAHPDRARVAVVHATTISALRTRRDELVGNFAEISAHEAAGLYGDEAWPPERARVQGIVFIGGLSELVATWLAGGVELDPDELAVIVADLFVSLSRRPEGQA